MRSILQDSKFSQEIVIESFVFTDLFLHSHIVTKIFPNINFGELSFTDLGSAATEIIRRMVRSSERMAYIETEDRSNQKSLSSKFVNFSISRCQVCPCGSCCCVFLLPRILFAWNFGEECRNTLPLILPCPHDISHYNSYIRSFNPS